MEAMSVDWLFAIEINNILYIYMYCVYKYTIRIHSYIYIHI